MARSTSGRGLRGQWGRATIGTPHTFRHQRQRKNEQPAIFPVRTIGFPSQKGHGNGNGCSVDGG